MKVYHKTDHAAASCILRDGFEDRTGTYLTRHEYTGVWVADEPLSEGDGPEGNVTLSLEVPETVLTEYEWVEEQKGFREFLLPAKVLNQYGPPVIDDHFYKGSTLEKVRQYIALCRSDRSGWGEEEAAEVEREIPFLIKHGLLAPPKS